MPKLTPQDRIALRLIERLPDSITQRKADLNLILGNLAPGHARHVAQVLLRTLEDHERNQIELPFAGVQP